MRRGKVLREVGRIAAWLLFTFAVINLGVDYFMYITAPGFWGVPVQISKWILESLCLYGWWRLK